MDARVHRRRHSGRRARRQHHREPEFPALLDALPVLGLAVWVVILVTARLRAPDW